MLSFSLCSALVFSQNNDDLEKPYSRKTDFDVITTSESRLIKDKIPTTDVSLKNYSYEFCLTEANAGGTLMYIRNDLSYKIRNDLNILYPLNYNLHLSRIPILKK